MSTTTSITPQPNPKPLLAFLLCAAAIALSFLSGSSATTSTSQLVTQTCARTTNERLCIDLLHSSNKSTAATTVHELAVVAVTAARRSVLRGRILWLDLSYQARARAGSSNSSSVADRLVARCAALYGDCLTAGAKAVGRVTFMPAAYDARVAHAVSDLRRFLERCEGLFDERNLVSPLEKVNTETVDKLRVASEIVRLLR